MITVPPMQIMSKTIADQRLTNDSVPPREPIANIATHTWMTDMKSMQYLCAWSEVTECSRKFSPCLQAFSIGTHRHAAYHQPAINLLELPSHKVMLRYVVRLASAVDISLSVLSGSLGVAFEIRRSAVGADNTCQCRTWACASNHPFSACA